MKTYGCIYVSKFTLIIFFILHRIILKIIAIHKHATFFENFFESISWEYKAIKMSSIDGIS